MKRYRSQILVAGIFLVLSLSFVIFQGYAQFTSSQTLELSPPSQEVTVDPGETVTVKVSVRNPDKQTVPVTARIEDFTAEGDEGQVQLVADSKYSLAGWSTVSPKSFSLAPGASQEVTTTIAVPTNAAGGRYGSVIFSVGATEETEGTGAKVAQEIASLFLLRIAGPVDETLSLESFQAPVFSDKGPVPLSVKLHNSGNVHVRTVGLINVTDMFNKKVEDLVIKPTNIFPKASRVLTADLDKSFLIGKYTATAIIYYGSKNESLTATTTLYVFPVKIAVVVFVGLLILYAIRKRLKKALKALFKG